MDPRGSNGAWRSESDERGRHISQQSRSYQGARQGRPDDDRHGAPPPRQGHGDWGRHRGGSGDRQHFVQSRHGIPSRTGRSPPPQRKVIGPVLGEGEDHSKLLAVEAALDEQAVLAALDPSLAGSQKDTAAADAAARRRKRRAAIVKKHARRQPPAAAAAIHTVPLLPTPAAPAVTGSAVAAPGAGPDSDSDDMFATSAADDVASLATQGLLGDTTAAAVTKRSETLQTLQAGTGAGIAPQSTADNFDDAEGYLRTRVGEMLGGRYKVQGSTGRGVFSMVSFCLDMMPGPAQGGFSDASRKSAGFGMDSEAGALVAVKILRANDTMRKAGVREVAVLQRVARVDPAGTGHVIRMLTSFEHRDHLCLVFEPMHLDLKEVQDKFGRGVGLSIEAVAMYARQLLVGLHTLGKAGLVHADLKPQNILANDKFNVVKIADLGSAFVQASQDNIPTPILVSRFYRAPETIMGLPHTAALDMWALAAVLYELFTGQVLFPGDDNNHMLHLVQQVTGRFPNKLIRKHIAAAAAADFEIHFNDDMRFIHVETDPVSKTRVARNVVVPVKPVDTLEGRLLAQKSSTDGMAQVLAFKDLLDRMLAPDPTRRISVQDALGHAFIKGPKPAATPA